MATQDFYASLKMTLAYEGGYSNHPLDPGAGTMQGVTQVVYDEDREDCDLPKRDVRMITQAELTQIYRSRYWERVMGDELPPGLDYAVFDFAVNSGVRLAVRKLQGIVAATIDGAMAEDLTALRQGATRPALWTKVKQVPAKEAYYERLKRQQMAFVETAIGPARARLFANGGLSAERFAALQLDRNFQPLTLDEMKVMEPLTFQRAGI